MLLELITQRCALGVTGELVVLVWNKEQSDSTPLKNEASRNSVSVPEEVLEALILGG